MAEKRICVRIVVGLVYAFMEHINLIAENVVVLRYVSIKRQNELAKSAKKATQPKRPMERKGQPKRLNLTKTSREIKERFYFPVRACSAPRNSISLSLNCPLTDNTPHTATTVHAISRLTSRSSVQGGVRGTSSTWIWWTVRTVMSAKCPGTLERGGQEGTELSSSTPHQGAFMPQAKIWAQPSIRRIINKF